MKLPASLARLLSSSVFRYGISGGTALLTEFGSFLILFYGLSANLLVANSVSFLAGFIASFTLGRSWAFKQDSFQRKVHHQVLLYLVLAGLNVSFSNGVVALMEYWQFDARIGKAVAIVAIATWNFFLFKYVIFRRGSRS